MSFEASDTIADLINHGPLSIYDISLERRKDFLTVRLQRMFATLAHREQGSRPRSLCITKGRSFNLGVADEILSRIPVDELHAEMFLRMLHLEIVKHLESNNEAFSDSWGKVSTKNGKLYLKVAKERPATPLVGANGVFKPATVFKVDLDLDQ